MHFQIYGTRFPRLSIFKCTYIYVTLATKKQPSTIKDGIIPYSLRTAHHI